MEEPEFPLKVFENFETVSMEKLCSQVGTLHMSYNVRAVTHSGVIHVLYI